MIIRSTEGACALLHAIVERGVDDIKALVVQEVIVDGECVSTWPCRDGVHKEFLAHYDRKVKVHELLHFFYSRTAQALLDALESRIDLGDDIIQTITQTAWRECRHENRGKI